MALAKHHEEIGERRRENNARIIDEFDYPRATSQSAEWAAIPHGEVIRLRLWVQRVNRECEERLSREMLVVYKLNKQRTILTPLGYMPKAEAVKTARWVAGGELLDLDDLYGGIFIRADHLFISETKFLQGLNSRPLRSQFERGIGCEGTP